MIRLQKRHGLALPILLLLPALSLAAAETSGTGASEIAAGDRSGAAPTHHLVAPAGTWYLRRDDGQRLRLELAYEGAGQLFGQVSDNSGTYPLADIHWQDPGGGLSFAVIVSADTRHWHRGQVVEGIYKGRMAVAPAGSPPGPADHVVHVTGWNSSELDRGLVPRVFDLTVNQHYRARLRIDADPAEPGRFTGQFKVHANTDPPTIQACIDHASGLAPGRWTVDPLLAGWTGPAGALWPAECEELEFDVVIDHWDGQTLQFTRLWHNGMWQAYSGVVSGAEVAGVFSQPGTPMLTPWSGRRAEVLGAGLVPPATELPAWQARTRARLGLLKMAGNPQPLHSQVTVLQSGIAPLPGLGHTRDDDPHAWPQDYELAELAFEHQLPNPHGATPLLRHGHGWLATPAGGTGQRRPAALVLNGHGGSARLMMTPDHPDYWYGDAFARRGYITLALDVSHRTFGDHPETGNGPHPPIAAPGFSSDWEEEGERIWTAMRAVDYLLSRPDVDGNRLVVAGLSMGGEVAALLGALDPRIGTVVVAGYTPDFNVMAHNNNHPCWQWQHADIREYLDMSDYLALIAPRKLIAITGRNDPVFSRFHAPFAADKQVMRRTRLATSGAAHWPGWEPVHFLHPGGHQFRVGDRPASGGEPAYVQVPLRTAPADPLDKTWQSDPATTSLGVTVFDLISLGQDRLYSNGFEPWPPQAQPPLAGGAAARARH